MDTNYVQALCFPASLYSIFLENFGLYEQMISIMDKIDFLQNTFLFGESISYPLQNTIARNSFLHTYEKNEQIVAKESSRLFLLKAGELKITKGSGEIVETLEVGDFCGEENFFSHNNETLIVEASQPSEVFIIGNYPLLEIPVVHWKLLEISAKRQKIQDSL